MKKSAFFAALLTLSLVSCQPKGLVGNIDENGNLTISGKVSQRYILIPGTYGMGKSQMTATVDGKDVFEYPQNVAPATDRQDYWIPVDMKDYKGKTVSLVLTGINPGDLAATDFKLSNEMGNPVDEHYRPVYHFTSPFGWNNDPNGMFYLDGTWHLSYQHNPYSTSWGNMTWGHATTKDLVHWTDHGDILRPDDIGAIFSGSAVIDHDNTAGFGKDAVIAIYTSDRKGERQSIAYSNDGGYTYTKYEGNPVLEDPDQRNFRDPNVTWIDGQWVMPLSVDQVVRFYGSPDLKHWTLLSEFGEGIGSHASVWECPDLFPLEYEGQTKWVLFVSITGPNNANNVQYFIGDFDGKQFTADPLPYPLWVDYGVNQYASVTWHHAPDGRRVFLGWLTSMAFGQNEPVTKYYSGGMTIPRELSLKSNGEHVILASVPSPELRAARYGTANLNLEAAASSTISASFEGAYEVELTMTPSSNKPFGFILSNTKGEQVVYTFDPANGKILTDRAHSGINGFSPKVANPIESVMPARDEYKVDLFIDRTSSEMFVNDGDVVITNCVFPTEYYDKITVFGDVKVSSSKVHGIK